MRLLLDTHVLLWVLAGDKRLTRSSRDILTSADTVVVSVVSAWEITLKAAAGKLRAPEDLEEAVRESGLSMTTLDFADVAESARLPVRHSDPFDRMLVAQARVRGLTMMSKDRQLEGYDVPLLLI
ncbi:MAG: type II toxin-antitoxin system VapC family toxin [Gemmatimonadaceae bacterium]